MNPSETTQKATDVVRPSRWLRRPKWQFSIREVVLVTTAIAALVALTGRYFQRPQQFQPSVVPKRVNDSAWIQATCERLGHPPPSSIGQPAEIAERSGRDGRQWRSEFTVAITPAQRGAFMHALQGELFVMERGFGLDECWARGKDDARGMAEFHHGYRKGTTAGSVWVTSADDPQVIRLSVLVQEHTAVR